MNKIDWIKSKIAITEFFTNGQPYSCSCLIHLLFFHLKIGKKMILISSFKNRRSFLWKINFPFKNYNRGSEFSGYNIDLRKMATDFELLTWKLLKKFFFRVNRSTSLNINSHFELLTWRLNFYCSAFELLTRS